MRTLRLDVEVKRCNKIAGPNSHPPRCLQTVEAARMSSFGSCYHPFLHAIRSCLRTARRLAAVRPTLVQLSAWEHTADIAKIQERLSI